MTINLGRYNKLIAAVVGSIVAYLLAWLAFQFPSIATCTVGPEGTEACSLLGFSQVDITAALMMLINAAFVFQSPPNKPPA